MKSARPQTTETSAAARPAHCKPDYKKPRIVGIVPAQPGYNVIGLCHSEDGSICEPSREPVIARAIFDTGMAVPVTLDGVQEDMLSATPIECPDGALRSSEQTWDSIGQWFAEMQKEARHA